MLGKQAAHVQKGEVTPASHTHDRQLKMAQQLHVKAEIRKLPEDNTGGNLCELRQVALSQGGRHECKPKKN